MEWDFLGVAQIIAGLAWWPLLLDETVETIGAARKRMGQFTLDI